MTLLAFQFGMQPILAREYNSKDLVKTSLVLSIEVSRKEYIRNIYSESDSRKVLAVPELPTCLKFGVICYLPAGFRRVSCAVRSWRASFCWQIPCFPAHKLLPNEIF